MLRFYRSFIIILFCLLTSALAWADVTESMTLLAHLNRSQNISYVLNGGVTNDYGWTSKQDMYNDLYAVLNSILGLSKVPANLEELKNAE